MLWCFFLQLVMSAWSKGHEYEVFDRVLDWSVSENVIQPMQRDIIKKQLDRLAAEMAATRCNVTNEQSKETKLNLESLFSEFIIYEVGIVVFVGGIFVLVMQADMISPNGVFLVMVSDFVFVSIFADLIATAHKTTTASVGVLFFVALISLPVGFFGIHYKLNQPGKKWNKKWATSFLFSKLRHFSTCCLVSELTTIVVGTLMLIKLHCSTTILMIPIFASLILFIDNILPTVVAKSSLAARAYYTNAAALSTSNNSSNNSNNTNSAGYAFSPEVHQMIFFVCIFCLGWIILLVGTWLPGRSVEMENVKFWFELFGSLYVSISLFGTANLYWSPKLQIGLIWVHVMLAHLGILNSQPVVVSVGSLGVLIYFIMSLFEVCMEKF
jgi:hypothetical protein